MDEPTTPKKRRPRRRFSDEFKAEAVRLVLDEGQTIAAVAKDLDLVPSALNGWVAQARADRTHGRTGLTTADREELARLRKENRVLREEREISKKSGGLLRQAPALRFPCIEAERAAHSITILCRCLRVTRSGFYAWRHRPESAHAQADRRLRASVGRSSRRADDGTAARGGFIAVDGDWQDIGQTAARDMHMPADHAKLYRPGQLERLVADLG